MLFAGWMLLYTQIDYCSIPVIFKFLNLYEFFQAQHFISKWLPLCFHHNKMAWGSREIAAITPKNVYYFQTIFLEEIVWYMHSVSGGK